MSNCPNNAEVHHATTSNSETGGSCSIFVLINELRNSLRLPAATILRLVSSLKPDNLNSRIQIQDHRPAEVILRDNLNFTLVKINQALAKHNLTADDIFKKVSHGNLEDFVPVNTLMTNVESRNPLISEEEKSKLIQHIIGPNRRSDNTLVTYKEWMTGMKATVEPTETTYLVSRQALITKMLDSWTLYQGEQVDKLMKVFPTEFGTDHLNRIPIDRDSFEGLITRLESNMTQSDLTYLYNFCQAFELSSNLQDTLTFKILKKAVLKFKLGGFGKSFYAFD